LSQQKLLGDPETFEFMFENLVARDVLAYAEVYHYREAANPGHKESDVDLVVELGDDEYRLIEVELGAHQTDDAEASLLHVSKKLLAGGADRPVCMMVISGTVPFAYTTEKGIKVVSLGCLGK
jgi:hypothetical protein